MLAFQFLITHPQWDTTVIDGEARRTSDDIAVEIQNQMKLALIRARKLVTKKTLNSLKTEKTLDSPSRGVYLRRVVGSKVIFYIESGRKPGKKMPPEAAMIDWFKALGIPQRKWFPIRLSIARKGIKPRSIVKGALRESRPYIAGRAANAGRYIAKNALKP